MHNLIYVSAASHLFTDEELIDILKISRLNNTRLGITGLLLYNEGSILQILEGEKEVINKLYDKIKWDNRHKGVIKMIDSTINERSFGDWSMGFKQISNNDWSELAGFFNIDNKEGFGKMADTGSTPVVEMIKTFANVNRMDI